MRKSRHYMCFYMYIHIYIYCIHMTVSRNGVYKIHDHMHVALPRIIPRIMPPNHTRESYHESYPFFAQGRAKHTPKHTPETYLRNIPRIIPPDATRFAGHGVFGKGHIYTLHLYTNIYIYILCFMFTAISVVCMYAID